MAAHQAPPSLGFSRQEPWSGLPFPSPMHESEKWNWRRSVMSDSSRSHGLQPTRLLHPWDFPGKSTGVGCNCITNHSNSYKCSLSGKVCKLFTSGQILTFFSALLKIVLHDNNKNNYYKNYFILPSQFLNYLILDITPRLNSNVELTNANSI